MARAIGRLFLATMADGPMRARMLQRFTEAFRPTALEVVDESASHAEHEAMRQGGHAETHFRVRIVSEAFAGKMAVQRHHMVYALLGDEFRDNGLHAIHIDARTPAEACGSG